MNNSTTDKAESMGPIITIHWRPNVDAKPEESVTYYSHTSSLFTSKYFVSEITKSRGGHPVKVTWPVKSHFDIYLEWTKRTVVSLQAAQSIGNVLDEKEAYENLIGMWLLGYSLQDTIFRDTVISLLFQTLMKSSREPAIFPAVLTPTVLNEVYETTVHEPRSTLRAFIVDMTVMYGSSVHVHALLHAHEIPKAFKATLQNGLSQALWPSPKIARPDARVKRILLSRPAYSTEMLWSLERKQNADEESERDNHENEKIRFQWEMIYADEATERRAMEELSDPCRYHEHRRQDLEYEGHEYAFRSFWCPLSRGSG